MENLAGDDLVIPGSCLPAPIRSGGKEVEKHIKMRPSGPDLKNGCISYAKILQ
jgi:hypothetical protein